jgi:cytoskeletal protein RodZ
MNGGIKMKLSYRAQQIIIIAAAAITCAGVVALIQTRLDVDEKPEESSSSETEIVFETPHEIKKPAVSSEITSSSTFTPSSGAAVSEPLTKVQKPSSTPPKPTPPSSSSLTDKSKKPTYSSKQTATSKSSSSNSASETPSGGKPGQIYVPGFGWQYPTGGSGTTVVGDWGEGSQVGIMD